MLSLIVLFTIHSSLKLLFLFQLKHSSSTRIIMIRLWFIFSVVHRKNRINHNGLVPQKGKAVRNRTSVRGGAHVVSWTCCGVLVLVKSTTFESDLKSFSADWYVRQSGRRGHVFNMPTFVYDLRFREVIAGRLLANCQQRIFDTVITRQRTTLLGFYRQSLNQVIENISLKNFVFLTIVYTT